METPSNNVKILFRFYSDVLEKETSETMWAEVVDEKQGFYKIDNIPFYVPLLACDDIVHAEFDEDEGFLTHRETLQRSGNSTVWVVRMDKNYDLQELRRVFGQLRCETEGYNEGFFAMDIPQCGLHTC